MSPMLEKITTGQFIEIADYDPAWPGRAAAEIARLRDALGGALAEIEHIGSTSVPGLAAKPIIDLMAAAADFGAVEAREDRLADLGYRRHANGMTERLLYVSETEDGRTACNFHIVTVQSWPDRNQRMLRDYLREHPEDAARYARLKREIAAAGTAVGDYARAKTDLIQELTDRARAERGLPSVPVWEK